MRDTIARNGFNAYAASVVPGVLYKISITAVTDDVDLLFFGTESSFTNAVFCAVDNTSVIGTSTEGCIIEAPGDTVYFGADGAFLSAASATYTISLEQLAITDLNQSVPVLDAVAPTGAAVYALPVTSGRFYTLGITGLNNDADMYVFAPNDAFIAPSICAFDNTQFTGATPEDCTLAPTSGTLYFIVDGIFSTAPSVFFAAFGALAPSFATPFDEGSAEAPVPLLLDTLRDGQVGFQGTSYYAASGLLPGGRYTVGINGLTNNANLTVYNNDGTFTNPASCLIDNTFFEGTTPEACTLIAAGSVLYFKVSASTTAGGAAFITLVEPGP